jgi:D-arabinose 1-dehydrogenase-like Zn-dependent alcohol dehydrogenase
VLVGAGKPEFTFNSIDLIQRAVELRGASTSGERSHLEAVLDLMAAGKVSTRAEEIGFEDIPAGLGRLARGEANGRQVATFGN